MYQNNTSKNSFDFLKIISSRIFCHVSLQDNFVLVVY